MYAITSARQHVSASVLLGQRDQDLCTQGLHRSLRRRHLSSLLLLFFHVLIRACKGDTEQQEMISMASVSHTLSALRSMSPVELLALLAAVIVVYVCIQHLAILPSSSIVFNLLLFRLKYC